jgi:hypothetical protein
VNGARQADALLALVEADRAEKVAAILGSASEQAAALRRDAHASARGRMRAAFAEERTMRSTRLAAARANLETRRRLALQRHSAAMLEAAWQALPDALAARWHEAAARDAWIATTVADARRVLKDGTWRIAHADAWPEAERSRLAAALVAQGVGASFHEEPALGSGLRIAAGGNVVDATGVGLLADRAEIGALLLALLEEAG